MTLILQKGKRPKDGVDVSDIGPISAFNTHGAKIKVVLGTYFSSYGLFFHRVAVLLCSIIEEMS